MRNLAILLLVAAASAQDDAATLFYRGFWLEQAEGKLEDAAALYGELLRDQPDAAEAPRALLGLVRIRVAANGDPTELVAELVRRYPAAKEEIAAAKRIVPAGGAAFDPIVREADSAVQKKLKELYSRKLGALNGEESTLLIDLGATAHPMLVALLHGQDADAVGAAAGILAQEGTAEACAVLARAILDETILFRGNILDMLRWGPRPKPGLFEALEELYARAGPRLRAEAVSKVALVVPSNGSDRDRVGAFLVRALGDEDGAVREAAVRAQCSVVASDAYVDALLRYFETSPGTRQGLARLPALADRPAFRDRIEKVLSGIDPDEGPGIEIPHEDAALLVARLIIGALRAGRQIDFDDTVSQVVQVSPRAATDLLGVALELDNAVLAEAVARGLGYLDENDQVARRKYLGEEANRLRAAAISMAPARGEPSRSVVEAALEAVGLASEDWPSILDGMRLRKGKGLPIALLDGSRLRGFGPEKAGSLVEFCLDENDALGLLTVGSDFVKRGDPDGAFFRQVVPKVGPGAARYLQEFMRRRPDPLVDIVVARLLAATDDGWGWGAPWSRNSGLPPGDWWNTNPGPYLWRAVPDDRLATSPLRERLFAFTDDPRREIAEAAASAAAADESEAGTAALRRALSSKIPSARAIALPALARRSEDGPALVRAFANRADLDDRERTAVYSAVAQGPAYADLVRELIVSGGWPNLWHIYKRIAPDPCVELALEEAVGDGPQAHRVGAVQVLVSVPDARRIEVFRRILSGADPELITPVLIAVRDQYVVELGKETLEHLRNPDAKIRAIATEAIDKLKFYAEARKTFEKG